MLFTGVLPLDVIIKTLEHYLCEVLNVRFRVRPWKSKSDLPLFLVNFYEFYEITLLEQPCLLMIAKEGGAATPAAVKKHRKQVQTKWDGLCIYVQATISAHNRQRLIQHRVPFIIPGNQMYLPDLGIDLREYYQQPKTRRKPFSPATQAVVIYALCRGISEGYTAFELVKELNYSRMTLIRSFNELDAAGIGKTHRRGRERYWLFGGSKRELWKQAKPLLRNPNKQCIWIKSKESRIKAGLSALAEQSMLNPPTIPIYATSMDDWKNWRESNVEVLPIREDATAELEIWCYNPNLFSEKGIVDPFSLYLSMEETEDERIEAALEEMMEKIEW